MSHNRKKLVLIAVSVMCIVLALAGCGDKTPDPQQNQTDPVQTAQPPQTTGQATTPAQMEPLEVLSVRKQDTAMVVETTYCAFKYPYAFSDLITVQAMPENGRQVLMFSALIDGGEYPLFALRFGDAEGIHVGSILLPGTGKTVQVWAELFDAGKLLDEGDAYTYAAAQECINDVIGALEENESFTPSE